MDHHLFLELRTLARYYEKTCKKKGLKAPSSPGYGNFEALVRFGEFFSVAKKMSLSPKEFLDLMVDQCARQKKNPPPHPCLAKDWAIQIVKSGKRAEDNIERSRIREDQINLDHNEDIVLIQQLRNFERVLQRSFGHMMTQEFRPNGWKLIFTSRKGESLAQSLSQRNIIPNVFKSLSHTWRKSFPDDTPVMDNPSDQVIECFNQLFPGDLVSTFVDNQ